MGRLTIPNFDWDHGGSVRIWVQNLDTYFQINPMTEKYSIKFATLHLDREAHEWWYHKFMTLGHNTINSYSDFTQKLMKWFDKKDPEIHFRELGQLNQIGSTEAFISEFQRVGFMVTDVSENRLTMLFTEALT